MKILFVQDYGINESLALMDLSAFLKSKGHICDLMIENNERHLFKTIKGFMPDLFIIPCDIGAHHWALKTCDNLKRCFGKLVIFCGTYPSFYPQIVGVSNVDVVCVGESEYALSELLKAIETKGDITGIQNLWVKENGRIYKNTLRPLIANLDELPLPDREIYYKYRYIKELSLKRFTSGRGCPNSCSYCYNSKYRESYKDKGEYVRRKSISRMLQEIQDAQEKSNVKSLHFSDDIFTHNKKWVLEFCQEYKRKINLPFTCNATADSLDEQLIKALKEAHCSGIAMGIETGNEKIRSFILNKQITNQQIIQAGYLIKKYGLYLVTFNMIALPGETIEEAFQTVEINTKIRPNHVRLTFTFPLPETKLSRYAIEKRFIEEDYVEKLSNFPPSTPLPVFKSDYKNQFKNLFFLFHFGVKFPSLFPLIKILIKFPFFKLYILLNFIRDCYCEKKFFNISLYSGIRYFLCAGNIRKRTKVFNNYMP